MFSGASCSRNPAATAKPSVESVKPTDLKGAAAPGEVESAGSAAADLAAQRVDPQCRPGQPATAFLEAGRGLISGVHDDTSVAFIAAAVLVVLFGIWMLTGPRQAEAAG